MSIEQEPRSEHINPPRLYAKVDLSARVALVRQQLTQDVLPVVPDAEHDIQRVALMFVVLEDVCRDFVKAGSGEQQTQQLLETPARPYAIPLGALMAVRSQFMQTTQTAEGQKAFEDMRRVMERGFSMMYGLIASIPDIYRNQTGSTLPPEEMRALIRTQPASQIFSELTNIPGIDAVAIEKILGMKHYSVPVTNDKDFLIAYFDETKLQLKNLATKPAIEQHPDVQQEIATLVRHTELPVFSCLAHHVKIPETGETFFQHLHDVFTERFCEHMIEE